MSQYFPKPFRSFGENIKVGLSNYATKTDLTNLASLKTEVDKLDKLIPVPVGLMKLSDVVKNYDVKKTCL